MSVHTLHDGPSPKGNQEVYKVPPQGLSWVLRALVILVEWTHTVPVVTAQFQNHPAVQADFSRAPTLDSPLEYHNVVEWRDEQLNIS